MKFILIALMASLSHTVYADYALAMNGKAVICSADDNQTWILNAKRSSLKYVIEGESLGGKRVKTKTDRATYVAYTSTVGTLTLSDAGDTFKFAEDDAEDKFAVDCEIDNESLGPL